jgi:hypothetical protein
MKNYLPEFKRFFSTKLFLSIFSISALLPLLQAQYWTFETAYFGYFGISPEIFSRPIFSSGFISVWLFADSILPVFWVWTFLMGAVFFVLFVINFQIIEPKKSEVIDDRQIDCNDDEVNLEDSTIKKKILAFITKLADSWLKSINLPIMLWGSGLILFFTVLLLFIWTSNHGAELAKKQMDSYIQDDFKCIDGFNSNNIGCFTIEGIDGEDHLVITNSKTHLIFLSREIHTEIDENMATRKSVEIKLHVFEKTTDEVFKITRDYKRKPGTNS